MHTQTDMTINQRTLTTFKNLDEALSLDNQKNYLFPLPHLSILDVVGDNATTFLQGQLTCDVHAVTDITMIRGAQCNLQGRINYLMDIFHWQGIKMLLPTDLVEDTIKSLNKAAQLSRVNIHLNQQLQVLGLYIQSNEQTLGPDIFYPSTTYGLSFNKDYCCYHLGDGFYIVICLAQFAQQLIAAFQEKEQILGSLIWHTLRLLKKDFSIYPESRGLFLPHRVDLHLTSMVNFNKGCYKGQEIIARMHYKATIKHQLTLFEVTTEEPISSGQKIFALTGAEAGEVVDYSLLGKNHYLVAASLLKDCSNQVLFAGHLNPVTLKWI
ncbi:MAG: folate-binding protein YgfZ [Legionella sp. 40-6]|nr:folate-binding protein YgfZ [Legionella sp.]OJY39328.1 MAG: folate-binding protein YgfZ [Legionella sp. 40-6]